MEKIGKRKKSKGIGRKILLPHPHILTLTPHTLTLTLMNLSRFCFSFNIENSRRTSRCVNLNSHQFLLIPTNSKSNTNKFRSIPSQSFRLELISIGIIAFLDLLLCLRFDGDFNQIVFQRK